MLVMSLLPLGLLQHLGYKTGHKKIVIWKIVLCIILFEISCTPYAYLSFLGWLDLIYFSLAWMFFYIARFLLPARVTVIAPVLFGLMLMYPASSFITMSNGHLAFSHDTFVIDLTQGRDKVLDFMQALFRAAWAVLPLVGVHYLMKSIEEAPRRVQS